MSTITYTLYGLNPFFGLELDEGAREVVFEVCLMAVDGSVVLQCLDVDTGQDYISITEDCTVTIVLKGDQLYFSEALEGIMTNQELSSYYGGLVYKDYDASVGRYKSVQFKARYNEGGKVGTTHSFDINVELLNVVKGMGAMITSGNLSITPDIKNPPPIDDCPMGDIG